VNNAIELPVITLPRPAAPIRLRAPQSNIPQTLQEREAVQLLVRRYVAEARPVPPLPLAELRQHAELLVRDNNLPASYVDYTGVLLNNELWRDSLAGVPYSRRLLLLPKCLRLEERCPAPFDEFGLLCKQCGLCSIQDLQNEAERLGYAVLVAEGSALVMAMIQTGKIDAIVGVSCLSVLEKAFPYMESAAIPGVAIPLLQDDCVDTSVDLDWVWEVVHLTSEDQTSRLDLECLRQEVETWFSPENLAAVIGSPRNKTEQIAFEWLSAAGKRWRPFLAVCAYQALRPDPHQPLPADLRRIAIAVECFHKASLIHDDIEDGDLVRYGEATVHASYGVPVALNVGDLLLGEGYRLIGECEASPVAKVQMLQAAARGHRTLCLGQGAELYWARDPQPFDSLKVLEIFRNKTSPAFEVALHLGAAYAGKGEAYASVLARYSEALGIAYQIRDDLEDLAEDQPAGDWTAMRPSLPLALAYERSKGDDRKLLASIWRRESDGSALAAARGILERLEVEQRCRNLLESYKEEAVRALAELDSASLKGLLRRVISKIFRVEIKGWCSEFEARNAASGSAEPQAVG
jgi:geranylgeranyl pyrophosphate synthase